MKELPYMTPGEFARLHGISHNRVRYAIRDGRIPDDMLARLYGKDKPLIHKDAPVPEALPRGLGSPAHPHSGSDIRPDQPNLNKKKEEEI